MTREEDELSERRHYDQFEPDMTSEPDIFTPAELKRLNEKLVKSLADPIDWESEL